MPLDDLILSDPERFIAAGDAVLAATASAGGQVRAAVAQTDRQMIAELARHGRPRAIVVVGAGGSSAAGEVLAACAGRGSSVPIVITGGPGLPGWVGPLDLVVVVSASGESPEALAVLSEAGRRGAQLVAIGGTALGTVTAAARGSHLDIGRIPEPRRARTLVWRLAVPLLLLAQELGVVEGTDVELAQAADELDVISMACGPGIDLGENLAKDLALLAAEGLALIWGTPEVPAAAARRGARQFAENAGIPALTGAFPEVARTHARILAGQWGDDADDIFRDRVEEPTASTRPHLVLLSDDACDPLSSALADVTASVAHEADMPMLLLDGGEGHPLVRLVRLIQPLDLASVYAAIALGVDPADTASGLDGRLGSGT